MQPTRRTVIQRSSLVTAGLLGTAGTTNATATTPAPSDEAGRVEGTITYGSLPVEQIEVMFDDEYSTETSPNGSYEQELEPGTYVLSVRADGYVDETRKIEVTADETTVANLELEREWGPNEGEFSVYVTEVGGGSTMESRVTIYGNGEEHSVIAPGGTIPDGDLWQRGFVVTEGWWEIRVSGIDGYGDGYDEVYVEAEESTRSRIEVPDEERTIHDNGWVAGTVTDADNKPIPETMVRVAGERSTMITTTAETGKFDAELAHGQYTMDVTADGYESVETDIAVRFGRITERDVTLESQ